MQIPCTITREQFADTDLAGRPYTLEFVHYAHAQTGERVRTKAHIIPALPARARNMKARRECKANDREAPAQSRGNVYLDARQNPAIRLSFGYNHLTRRTTQVLTVRGGRVVIEWMTPEAFAAAYEESDIPPLVAARALDSIGRAGGIDPEARRYLLFALNAPAWRLALNAYGFVFREKCTRVVRQLFGGSEL